jgi:hypothetical protein
MRFPRFKVPLALTIDTAPQHLTQKTFASSWARAREGIASQNLEAWLVSLGVAMSTDLAI